MLYKEARDEIVRTGVRVEAEGLLSTTAGNISCPVGPGLIAITPTSVPYPEIEPEDVVITDLDRHVVDGSRRPSSELPFHTTVCRARPDVGGVVHTHSPYALRFKGWSQHQLVRQSGAIVKMLWTGLGS